MVTAQWLNDVQERVQDLFAELNNVLALANLTPNGAKQNQVAEAIAAYVCGQLTNDLSSDSEVLGLSAKAGKNLKGLIDSNVRSLANVIPNSKKSDAVNSASSDTVATSKAVKVAYDLAGAANENANGRIRRTGALHDIQLSWRNTGLNAQVDNTSLGVFLFENVFENKLVGIPLPYPLPSVPAGFLAMNGQRFDTNLYPKLAQKYPSGALPDLRGEFIRGWDNKRGVDAGRVILSSQTDLLKSHNHEFAIRNGNGWYDKRVEFTAKTDDIAGSGWSSIYMNRSDNGGINQSYALAHWVGIRPNGGNETRPRNIAFQYICLAA